MPVCCNCGKKGFFLRVINGLCPTCLKEAQEKESLEYQAAAQKFDETLAIYKQCEVDLSTCTLNELRRAISLGRECCGLLACWKTTPQMNRVIEDRGIRDTNSLLGHFLRLEQQLDKTTLHTEDVINGISGRCAKYESVLEKSLAFDTRLKDIPPSPTPLKSGGRLPFTLNVPPLKDANITKRTTPTSVGNFVAIDIETTGLSIQTAEIIEVAAVKFVNFEPVEVFSSFVKPKGSLNVKAQQVNHITDADLSGAPGIEDVMPLFDSYLGSVLPIVGHNLNFDYSFLFAYGSQVMRDTMVEKRKFFDTLALAKRTFDWHKNSLDFLCRRELGLIRDSAHSALSDAVSTGLLFSHICAQRIGLPVG